VTTLSVALPVELRLAESDGFCCSILGFRATSSCLR
jgi:hypothetical protein